MGRSLYLGRSARMHTCTHTHTWLKYGGLRFLFEVEEGKGKAIRDR